MKQEKEIRVPFVVKSNWVYQLMWISKYVAQTTGNVVIEDFNIDIESRALDITSKISYYRLNYQMKTYLQKFRQFEE
jgi:hypothetical protein